MIAWPIAAARASGLFERIVVSTDDDEIARIARACGAEVPFRRPADLANDTAGTVPVVAHAVREMNDRQFRAQNVCCIYPCTPFLRVSDLVESLSAMRLADADFIYPVVEYPHPTFRAMRRSPRGQMQFVFPECEMMRTQDLEKTYHDAGQFYWGKADAWLAMKRMHSDGIGMVVPSWRFVDVDTEDDWRRAELFLKSGISEGS